MIKEQNIYFVGIGGIGMSALAQLLRKHGKHVTGSDRDHSPTTDMLAAQGVHLHFGHDATNVPRDTEVVIYSDAVPEDNPERVRAKGYGARELSYFEALGEVSEGYFTIAIAGTHGKTTTTGMLGKILIDAGFQPTVIVGSIMKDFGSNFVAGRDDLLVVEACEYRDHLLKLNPNILVITNIEFDHSDYFKDLTQVQDSFKKAAQKVGSSGTVITNPGHTNIAPVVLDIDAKVVDYTTGSLGAIDLFGEFNVQNALAAKAAAKAYDREIRNESIDESLQRFQGGWRRFEYKGETEKGALVYDDYAHHPTEIEETLKAVREKFPTKNVVVAFHPHLFSRTKSFFYEFAESLAGADEVILAPIYPAREEDTGEVSSELLVQKIRETNHNAIALSSFEEIEKYLREKREGDLIVTMGAGDIFKVADAVVSEIN